MVFTKLAPSSQHFNFSTFQPNAMSLSPQSKVWIYQSNRPLAEAEEQQILPELQAFAQSWVSHNRQLRAGADILHQRFVVLAVDETQADASGCSIDKSVHFLKGLEQSYGLSLFERMIFSYQDAEGKVHTVDRDTFAQLYASGAINDETPVFDPLVDTLGDLQQQFVKPLGQSWHKRMV